jgi:hypothetical protein
MLATFSHILTYTTHSRSLRGVRGGEGTFPYPREKNPTLNDPQPIRGQPKPEPLRTELPNVEKVKLVETTLVQYWRTPA